MKLYGYDWPYGGRKEVVYVDDQGRVIELEMGLDIPWNSADLTELTGAPPSAGIDLVGYAWSAEGTKQVAYVDNRKHVIELVGSAGKPWQWSDLRELTGAPLPCSTSLVGYDWSRGDTKQVVYVDGRGHVIELFVAEGKPWQWADLSELTGAPLPCSTSLVGYAWSAGGTKQVAYMDGRGHVIELFVAVGDPWQWVDLTELTRAPLVVQESLAGYDWLNGNTKQVVYVDDQGHVIELLVAVGNPWQCTDLTALTQAPLLHQKPVSGYGSVWGATKQVVYEDEQGRVIELWSGFGGQWHYAILLQTAERRPA